ncbi:DUF445 family protein [Aquibacillus salsiterrae]|uniref:DUF445 family protein n=1 Tax=Aquibacillus salsiterrae TaxID=2950439 RepID=A0A9X3WHS7_9BACI|nr:DUF445 family protein [Aquibacillus salsiterrae]MDC3417286.1 DUF445 family protein [Aquibacillus salsiterrae]
MATFFLIVLMVIIGAVIGGVTNSLAIKMLFRPYQPKYIGKWRLPFTPGLIPKRRDELAKQLGKTVVDHLLTAEGLQNKLQQSQFQEQVIQWSQDELSRFMNKKQTTREFLASVGIYLKEEEVKNSLFRTTKQLISLAINQNSTVSVRNFVKDIDRNKTDDTIDKIAAYLQRKISDFLASDQAGKQIGILVESYLDGKGFFGNMIASFLGNEGIAEKVQPLLVSYCHSEEAKDLLKVALSREWENLLDKDIGELRDSFEKVEVDHLIAQIVSYSLPVDQLLGKTVDQWMLPIRDKVLYHVLPVIVTQLLTAVSARMSSLLDKLDLEQIVENEVGAFPIARVEELVLNISKKEFKMITYLGALLGGGIGLFQGILVVLIG